MRIEELQKIFSEDDGGKVLCAKPMSHGHDDRYYTKSEIDARPGGTSDWNTIQNKPATFPPQAHTHDYAATNHNHDGSYSPVGHDHAGTYAPSVHTHDYAATNHVHPYEPANANIQTHVTSPHAPANAQKNSDITKAEIEAKLTGAVTTHTHDYAATNHVHPYEPANANIQTHVTSPHAPANAQKNSDILKAEIEAVLTGVINSHSHSGSSDNVVATSVNTVNNNAVANTLADIPGLSFPVTSGTRYWFEATIPYTAQATTTGSRWVINGPTGTYSYTSEWTLTATTKTINCLGAVNLPAACNATSLTTGNLATIWGCITPSANGTIQVRFASEVTASAITALPAILKWRAY